MSNSRDVLSEVPDSERAPAVKNIDLDHEGIPAERALGVQWNPESDTLSFSVQVSDKPPPDVEYCLTRTCIVFAPQGVQIVYVPRTYNLHLLVNTVF